MALPDGNLVVEGRHAERLDLSRMRMREAILPIASEGLLVKQGSRSDILRQVQPVDEFVQGLKTRVLLEDEAVELAIGRVPADAIAAPRGHVPAQHQEAVAHEGYRIGRAMPVIVAVKIAVQAWEVGGA